MKMLGSKTMSQRYILHRIYIVSKINIPNHTLRTKKSKYSSWDNPQGCFHHSYNSVGGEGTDRKFQLHMPQP